MYYEVNQNIKADMAMRRLEDTDKVRILYQKRLFEYLMTLKAIVFLFMTQLTSASSVSDTLDTKQRFYETSVTVKSNAH